MDTQVRKLRKEDTGNLCDIEIIDTPGPVMAAQMKSMQDFADLQKSSRRDLAKELDELKALLVSKGVL